MINEGPGLPEQPGRLNNVTLSSATEPLNELLALLQKHLFKSNSTVKQFTKINPPFLFGANTTGYENTPAGWF